MERVKVVDFITCNMCLKRLKQFKGAVRNSFIQERELLPRCKGCKVLIKDR